MHYKASTKYHVACHALGQCPARFPAQPVRPPSEMKERFARREIDKEEFEESRRVLGK
jgi:hypothetical protein